VLHTETAAIRGAAARRAQGERAARRGDERKVARDPRPSGEEAARRSERYQEQGADKPFLDVWFADASNGYVVGAYNLIFRTATAARRGRVVRSHRQPQILQPVRDSPRRGDLYIAGESGSCMKLDAAGATFTALRCHTRQLLRRRRRKQSVLAFGCAATSSQRRRRRRLGKVDAVSRPVVAAARPHDATLARRRGRPRRRQRGRRANVHEVRLKQPCAHGPGAKRRGRLASSARAASRSPTRRRNAATRAQQDHP
jgi:hypothetical protein